MYHYITLITRLCRYSLYYLLSWRAVCRFYRI